MLAQNQYSSNQYLMSLNNLLLKGIIMLSKSYLIVLLVVYDACYHSM